mgnify:CR=1 FL=1
MSENLVNFIDKISEDFANKPGLLFKPGFKYVSWTYKQLGEDSKKAASYFKSLGLEKNDRVIIWAPNSPMWVISFFACVRSGLILVPLDIKSPPEFVDTVISKTNPKLVLLSRFTPVDCNSLDVPVMYLEDLTNLLKGENDFDPIDISADDIAEVMFTSGTTGDPKGVILTHQNLMSNLDSVSKTIRGKSSDRLLSILPLSHMFEQMGIDTDIDVDKLIECVWMLDDILGRPTMGHVSKAGPFPTTSDKWYDPNAPFVETFEQVKHFKLGPSVYEGGIYPWKEKIRSSQRPDTLTD